MSFRTRAAIATLVMSFAATGTVVLAQQPQANNPNPTIQEQRRAGIKRRAMRRQARRGAFRGLRQLDLTDQQKQQARSIIQAQAQSTQTQRQELRQLMQQRRAGTLDANGQARAQELRRQLMEGRKAVHTQLTALLTAEQKAKLEESRKARHDGLLKRRRQPPIKN